jgi:hypothetical protein
MATSSARNLTSLRVTDKPAAGACVSSVQAPVDVIRS